MAHDVLYTILADDHRRLEALLEQTRCEIGTELFTVFDDFRRGLLRHISIEEKVLLPAVQRMRGGSALPIADRLRLDHGAIAALLVPPPSRLTVTALFAILEKHNVLEEGPGGFYEACEELAGAEMRTLVDAVRAAGAVPLSPHINNPNALDATRRALARAGYNLDDYAGR